MCNVLNKHIKFIKIFFIFCVCFALNMSSVFAQRRGQRFSSTRGRGSIRTATTKASVSETTVVEPTKSTPEIQKEFDVKTITKYNCEDFYNRCMNKVCFTNENGRCNCSKSEVFKKENLNCSYIIDACPNLSVDIVKTFARNASADCRDFALKGNIVETKNIYNYLADLITCLRPKCRDRRSGDFVGCFDKDNLQAKLKICENVYANVADKDDLMKRLEASFSTYKLKYCDDMLGVLKEDGNCYLTIGMGPGFNAIKRQIEFKVGDDVVCSTARFGVSMGEDEVRKFVHKQNIVMTSFDFTSKGLDMAADIVDVAQQGDVGAKDVMSLVGSGLDIVTTVLPVVEDVIMLKDGDFSYLGKCFVMKDGIAHELFQEDDTVLYKLRWSENWDDNIY